MNILPQSEDNPKDDQTMLKDLEEMSDEEFMLVKSLCTV